MLLERDDARAAVDSGERDVVSASQVHVKAGVLGSLHVSSSVSNRQPLGIRERVMQ